LWEQEPINCIGILKSVNCVPQNSSVGRAQDLQYIMDYATVDRVCSRLREVSLPMNFIWF